MFKFIRRALNLPVKVGTDSFGNKYYEKITEGKVARWVVQRGKSNPVDYDTESIPNAWKSWLSRTRQDPPIDNY